MRKKIITYLFFVKICSKVVYLPDRPNDGIQLWQPHAVLLKVQGVEPEMILFSNATFVLRKWWALSFFFSLREHSFRRVQVLPGHGRVLVAEVGDGLTVGHHHSTVVHEIL